jgi:hypothetical protein
MSLDFGKYLETYQSSGDDDDDEVNGPLWNLNMDCTYHDIDNIQTFNYDNHGYKFTAMHLNIHSLPSKYDQLRTMLGQLRDRGISIHFVMLCETFLTDVNCNMFPIPGYQFVCKNRGRGRGGGVALYIWEEFQFSIRDDLSFNFDLEFESVFVEVGYHTHKCIVGEIYRVPNTNEKLSLQRYEAILANVSNYNGDVMIGTDQNFNYLDIERHTNTRDLLNICITAGFIPTITKASD